MTDWTEAKEVLRAIQERHFSESGKILQKLLALTFRRLGYEHLEERSVQGVDLDVFNSETGERHSLEVKTSRTREVFIGKKDIEGLRARAQDGYDTYYAVLCLPLCFSEGWIIVPAAGLREGTHQAMGLLRGRHCELSQRVNILFPDVIVEVGSLLLTCTPGSALSFLKEKWTI